MSSAGAPVALVSGANRGIGAEVAHQLARRGAHVLVGSRRPEVGADTAEGIRRTGGMAEVVALDVSIPDSVDSAARRIAADPGRLDILVNNAAVGYDSGQRAASADLDEVRATLETNLWGAWRLTQALLPMLRDSGQGRIVNVSSGAGALQDMGPGLPAYRISKVGLNALTRMLAAEEPGLLVNAVCPGWVATDMGGAGGRPVGDGAAGVVWAATLPDGGPSGGFFRDRRPIAW